MSRALFIIDVQNDFTEGGALGVEGGDAVALGITRMLREHPHRYRHVFASRDWHDAGSDNGGHFAAEPDFVDTWPVHCVAGTRGAEYDPGLDVSAVDVHVRKGMGEPAYSIFDGVTVPTGGGADAAGPGAAGPGTVAEALDALGVTDVDVVGIATDYCVRASALDALAAGRRVRVLTDLVAGVAAASSVAALDEIVAAGGRLATSDAASV
ncbi:MAG: isochorismatase family protein [Microbacteriaceae bacterium]